MTAKGERVRKPPRRLQQLETSQREQEQHRRVMAIRANVKQANAERQRMVSTIPLYLYTTLDTFTSDRTDKLLVDRPIITLNLTYLLNHQKIPL